jgi:hypothetical protein
MKFIKGVIEVVTGIIHGDWSKVWQGIKDIFTGIWDAIGAYVQYAIDLVKNIIDAVGKVIAGIWDKLWHGFLDLVTFIWGGIIGAVESAIGAVAGFVAGIPGRIAAYASSLFNGIKDGINSAKTWVSDRIDDVVDFVKGIPNRLLIGAMSLFQSIKDGVDSAKTWVSDKIDGIVDFVTGLPSRIAKAASGMWDGIKDAFKSALNWIIRGWNGIEFKLPSITIPMPPGVPDFHFGGQTIGLPDIPLLAKGGTIMESGLAIVGERGPELVSLPRGATVHPNGTGPGEGMGISQEIHFHGITDFRELARQAAREASWALRTRTAA